MSSRDDHDDLPSVPVVNAKASVLDLLVTNSRKERFDLMEQVLGEGSGHVGLGARLLLGKHLYKFVLSIISQENFHPKCPSDLTKCSVCYSTPDLIVSAKCSFFSRKKLHFSI